jgi:hypothetical protein
MRRALALLLVGPLLHLNVVRADTACATHPAEAAAAPAREPGSDAQAHHQHGAPAPATDEESCEVPAQVECCQALASCGPTLGGDPASADHGLTTDRHGVPATQRTLPLSATAAPEPPPPRA